MRWDQHTLTKGSGYAIQHRSHLQASRVYAELLRRLPGASRPAQPLGEQITDIIPRQNTRFTDPRKASEFESGKSRSSDLDSASRTMGLQATTKPRTSCASVRYFFILLLSKILLQTK